MIHMTTHRISFHASLLSVRPDILPDEQVIKKGPVTVHRPGLHRKRRIWLELSHDMLTTFPSGSDADRIRPIKSILRTHHDVSNNCLDFPDRVLLQFHR